MATLPDSGGVPCACDTEPYVCGCNARAPENCTCLVPRCRQCHGLMPNDLGLLDLRPPLNSSNADRYYPGVPRTTSRVHVEGTNWGTATSLYADTRSELAQQASSSLGFSYLPIRHTPATEARLNRLGAVVLPRIPFGGIIRHNSTIVNAEAPMLHSPSSSLATMPNGSNNSETQLGPRDRRLISSCSEDRYVFTPGNSPPQQPHPRASLSRHSNENLSENRYTPHLRGGGRPARGRKAKPKTKKTPWDNENLMAEDTAFLYESGESRSKLQALLGHPSAEQRDSESTLHQLPAKRVKHATKVFQDNGIRRFNDPEFISEAIGASGRRREGDFEEFEAYQFADEWIDSESSEEYGEEQDLNMSESMATISGFDGASDEYPRAHTNAKRSLMHEHEEDVDMSASWPAVSSFDGASDERPHGEVDKKDSSADALDADVDMSKLGQATSSFDGASDETNSEQATKKPFNATTFNEDPDTSVPQPSSLSFNGASNEEHRAHASKKRLRASGSDDTDDDREYKLEAEDSEEHSIPYISQTQGDDQPNSLQYFRDDKEGGNGGSSGISTANNISSLGNYGTQGQPSHSETQQNHPPSQYNGTQRRLHPAIKLHAISRVMTGGSMSAAPVISYSSSDSAPWILVPSTPIDTPPVPQYQTAYHTPQELARHTYTNDHAMVAAQAEATTASQYNAPSMSLRDYVRSLSSEELASTSTSSVYSSPYSSLSSSPSIAAQYIQPSTPSANSGSYVTTRYFVPLSSASAIHQPSVAKAFQPSLYIATDTERAAEVMGQEVATYEPNRQRYPSPPLGGLNGNFYPELQSRVTPPLPLSPTQGSQMTMKRASSTFGDASENFDQTMAQPAKRLRGRYPKPSLR